MLKKVILCIFLITVFMLSFVTLSFALHEWVEGYNLEPYWAKPKSPLVVRYDNDSILDLTKNIVVARGESYLGWYLSMKNRERVEAKAIQNSIKGLEKVTGQLRVNTDARVSNIESGNPALSAKISQKIKDSCQFMHFRIFTMNGTLRVTSSVKYGGQDGILSVIYPYLISTVVEAAEVPQTAPGSVEIGARGDYTGLIIDARKLKLEPAIDPKIVDQTGKEVYGDLSKDDIDLLIRKGVVEYSDSPDAAYKDPRIGKNPLVIAAAGARRNCDPIVSADDGARIERENKASGFLDELNVIIII